MDVIFRPLVGWPVAPTSVKKRAAFRSTYNDTLRLLDRELGALKAMTVVIQVALDERDIRLDGVPRAGSRPWHSGIILSFESKFGALSYPCDVFEDWEDNLRAIALSLQHLRAVDRYGVTKRGEQYRGWTSLPPPKPVKPNGFASRNEAAGFIVSIGGGASVMDVVSDRECRDAVYRRAALVVHPDRGGDKETFQRLNAAKEFLDG